MKKFLVPMLAAALTFVGCTRELEDRMEILESKVDWLEAQVTQINANITNIQTALNAINSNVWVTSVSGNNADGYVIRFSDGKEAVIKNGNDGAPGAAGEKGEQGVQGESPVVSATAIDGVYYWTVNGETVKDAEGNPLPVTGMAPQVKAEGGKWYASYDGGKTWEVIGTLPASGSGSGITAEVTDEAVILYLSDTESVSIPLIPTFALVAANTSVGINAGGSAVVAYTIKGAAETDDVVVYVDHVSAGWTATVDEAAATVAIQAAEGQTTGLVVIAAVNNTTGASSAQALRFEEGVLQGPAEAIAAAKDGGEIEVTVSTNVEYTVSIDVDWIKAVETKAAHTETLKFTVEENTGNARTGNITIKGSNGTEIVVVVTQESGIAAPKDITKISNLWGYQITVPNPHGMTVDANRTMAVIGDYLIISDCVNHKFPVYNRMTGEYLGNEFVNMEGVDAPSVRQIRAITNDDAGHLIALTYCDTRTTDSDTNNDTVRGWIWKDGIDKKPASVWWVGLYNYGAGATWAFSNVKCAGDVTKDAVVATSTTSGKCLFDIFTDGKLTSSRLSTSITGGSAWHASNVKPINGSAKTVDELKYVSCSGNFRMYPTYYEGTTAVSFDGNYPSCWNMGAGTYARTGFGCNYFEANGHHFYGIINGWSSGSDMGTFPGNGANRFYCQLVVSDLGANPTTTSFKDGALFGSRMSSVGGILEGVGYNEKYFISPFAFTTGNAPLGENNQEGDVVFAQSADGSVQVYALVMNLGLIAYNIEF